MGWDSPLEYGIFVVLLRSCGVKILKYFRPTGSFADHGDSCILTI